MLQSVLAMLLLGVLHRVHSNPYCAAVFGPGCVDSAIAAGVFSFVFLWLFFALRGCCFLFVGVVPFFMCVSCGRCWVSFCVDFASSAGAISSSTSTKC